MVLVIYNLMDVILPVKDSPCSITWIPLHEMSTFTFRVEEMVNLSVNTDHGFAMAGMDFVSTVVAQRNLHDAVDTTRLRPWAVQVCHMLKIPRIS